mmetsp:Transcript_30094/g.75762  ORF Transcript_30094/g.75762 Transcript_30094/m.75762 type:complete len:96 (+) Transcript_30094:136-423(+)
MIIRKRYRSTTKSTTSPKGHHKHKSLSVQARSTTHYRAVLGRCVSARVTAKRASSKDAVRLMVLRISFTPSAETRLPVLSTPAPPLCVANPAVVS